MPLCMQGLTGRKKSVLSSLTIHTFRKKCCKSCIKVNYYYAKLTFVIMHFEFIVAGVTQNCMSDEGLRLEEERLEEEWLELEEERLEERLELEEESFEEERLELEEERFEEQLELEEKRLEEELLELEEERFEEEQVKLEEEKLEEHLLRESTMRAKQAKKPANQYKKTGRVNTDFVQELKKKKLSMLYQDLEKWICVKEEQKSGLKNSKSMKKEIPKEGKEGSGMNGKKPLIL